VDLKGAIYVCDTFNHRIQKFDSKGQFLKVWSHNFFGPRSITGNNRDRVYVVDTGNHKVQVFDPEGNFLSEFGGFGTGDGKFREPVGSTVDSEGFLYVADSDNTRIQKFDPMGKFISSFRVSTWRGKNEESPYLAFGQGFLYASNASAHTVLKYDLTGKLVAILKRKEKDGFSTATGVAADHQNRLYVVERGPGKVARFLIPSGLAPQK
jgi:DNA-binding beta-propeller fold protein YncE